MVDEARMVRFPIGLRGYDRTAVNRYVEKVTRLIAELEISSSPESAVRHALDELGEETGELLQRAHQTADEITARSRAKADERIREAEREAAQLTETSRREAQQVRDAAAADAAQIRQSATGELAEARETAAREADKMRESARRDSDQMLAVAEARASELTRNAQAIWRERRRLIDDVTAVGEQLTTIGEAESKRFIRFSEDADDAEVEHGAAGLA
jgi:cell division septum initiation protein DivIVA